MPQNVRLKMLQVVDTLKVWREALWTAVYARWTRVTSEDRVRLRNHALAVAAASIAAVISLAAGFHIVGPFVAIDFVAAGAAWFGGWPVGVTASLAAALAARVGAASILEAPLPLSVTILALAKWLIVSAAAAALSAKLRDDKQQICRLEDLVQLLHADTRQTREALSEMETASASATALLRDDANLARQQLTALQSVTDPALNVLSGVELVGALLDRLRTAVAADGVAIYHHNGLRSRVFSSTDGVAPASGVMRRPAVAGYQSGRTTLIHNDCDRVAETSLCQWPSDMASLIVVPVVYSGRLQLVVEVASRRARRSTEWELALIQVVAERAAGLLRPDANFDTGAVA